MPKVSVIMSVYNGERYLRESVDSILNQTFQDFEFIIVNDGSADNTMDILRGYRRRDPRVRIIDQQNLGLTKSLNKAIYFSRAEFIARQDVDDISLSERLAKEYEALSADKNTDLVCSWYYIIDEYGKMILERKLPDSGLIAKIMKRQNLLAHSSVMFRKSSFLRAGGYDEKYKYGQDWFLWMKMNSIKVLPESLLKYRWGTENITHKRHSIKINIKNRSEFLERRKVSIISSLLLQQGELKKSRELLRKNLYCARNVLYYLLTFSPKPFVAFCIWDARYYLKRFLRKHIAFYKKRLTYG